MNLLTWLEQRIAEEGEGRLELWRLGKKRQTRVAQWPLKRGDTTAAPLAVEILALVGVARPQCTGHAIFVYDGESWDEPARARAFLHDGMLLTTDRWSPPLLDGLLEDVLARCEQSARLQREVERVFAVTGMRSKASRR
jgi:hypothetical protein